MARDAKYMRLAVRAICRRARTRFCKDYYVPEDFETVTASCPVPIVIAGAKKLPEPDALGHGIQRVQQGASGVTWAPRTFSSPMLRSPHAAGRALGCGMKA